MLEDSPEDSSVHGLVTSDGYFDGTITTPSETYYIEPSHKYLKNHRRRKRDSSDSDSCSEYPFHSVIYKSSDVTHPNSLKDENTPCKSHELHLKNQEGRKHTTSDLIDKKSVSVPLKQTLSTTYEIMDWADVPENVRNHFRRNNALLKANRKIDRKKTTCMLYLQADHLFFEELGSEEAAIEVMTRHVQRVNSIYRPVGKNCIIFVITIIGVLCMVEVNKWGLNIPLIKLINFTHL